MSEKNITKQEFVGNSDSSQDYDLFSYVKDMTHTLSELKQIVYSLKDEVDYIKEVAGKSPKMIYTSSEVMKMLDVCPNTLKYYRDNGMLGYSRVGDKCFYTTEDLLEFMGRNHHVAFKYEDSRA